MHLREKYKIIRHILSNTLKYELIIFKIEKNYKDTLIVNDFIIDTLKFKKYNVGILI